MPTFQVSVPARVCLCGDNMDWMGHSSILCALDSLRLSVRITESRGSGLTIRSASFIGEEWEISRDSNYAGNWADYARAVIKVLSRQGVRLEGLDVSIDSAIPQAVGLGSSAALCVGVCAAINSHARLALTTNAIAHLAYLAERYEMGIPCGQMDQYSVAYGGVLFVNCAQEPPAEIQRFENHETVSLVVGHGQIKASTVETINWLKARLETGDALMGTYVRETETTVLRARGLFRRKPWDLQKIGALVSKCHCLLQRYSQTSTEQWDTLVKASIDSGALGAKLAAGKGGSVFALCLPELARAVAASMEKAGAQTHITGIASQGSKLEEYT